MSGDALVSVGEPRRHPFLRPFFAENEARTAGRVARAWGGSE